MRKYQKLITLVLALALLTSLVLPAAAAYPDITPGQTLTATVTDDESAVIFRFVPTQDGHYRFYSHDNDDADPYGYIMDEDMEILVSNDDHDGLNFQLSQKFLAGKTYYLAATTYSGAAEYQVTLEQQAPPTSIAFDEEHYSDLLNSYIHTFITFYPEGCGSEAVTYTSSDPDVVSVDEEGYLYFLRPGTVTVTAVSESGLTASCTATAEAPVSVGLEEPFTLLPGTREFREFTAPAAGWYGVYSSGDPVDTTVELYDSDMNQLAYGDDELPGYHFFTSFYLEKGELCYFLPWLCSDTGSCTVTVTALSAPDAITVPQSVTGYAGGCADLPITQSPAVSAPETFYWSSDNEDVATVYGYGYVYFNGPGTTTLRYTTESGKSGTVSVTVLSEPTGSSLVSWGSCGPELLWKLDTKGQLTVTGSGDMYDDMYFWDGYQENITKVSLPQGITSIGSGAFSDCANLESINLPEGITSIGNFAFSYCYSLSSLTLPQSLQSIGYAGLRSTSLTEITLPESLTQLGPYAFEHCEALEKVEFEGSLKQLPVGAFIYCYALKELTLPQGLQSIGDTAFDCCGLQTVDLPNTLETLGYGAFSNASLTELELPESLTTVHSYAFYNCPLEGELVIPKHVAYLGENFLGYNELSTLHFRGDAPEFHEYALCELSVDAYYSGSNATWTEDVLQSYGGEVTWHAVAPASVALSGKVNRANNAAVTLSLSDGSTQTVSAQSYSFSGVTPGSVTLTASAENHVTRIYELDLTGDTQLDITVCLLGDVTGDGRINVADTGRVYAHVKGTSELTDYAFACGDVTGDGKINVADTGKVYAHVKGSKKLF